jgi:hypothetical protein
VSELREVLLDVMCSGKPPASVMLMLPCVMLSCRPWLGLGLGLWGCWVGAGVGVMGLGLGLSYVRQARVRLGEASE